MKLLNKILSDPSHLYTAIFIIWSLLALAMLPAINMNMSL